MNLNESIVEDANLTVPATSLIPTVARALAWFAELGYSVGHGPQLAPGEPEAEREAERDSRGGRSYEGTR